LMSKSDFEDFLSQAQEVASLIHKNLDRTAQLVNSFKQVSVDQTSELARDFNVNEYIQEVLLSLSSVLKRSKLDSKIICDQHLIIYSYPGLLSQIISNLVINSNIHGFPNNEQGKVMIEVSVDEGELLIEYRDNGCGIKEENLSKIFDPFYTTNRHNGGSGLGLNIVYNIVTKQLRGTINCFSESGVRFVIRYPVKLVSI